MTTEKTTDEFTDNNWKTLTYKQKYRNTQCENKSNNNSIPLRNRFDGMFIDDNTNNDDDTVTIQDTPMNKNVIKNKRPEIVSNPENNLSNHHRSLKRTSPGNSNYSNITKQGKKVCIFSDSICKRINMNKFNSSLINATAIKRSYPGATTSQMIHYVIPTLEEENPDIVVISIGTNNFTKTRQSPVEIANEIITIINTCRDAGVNEIYVSSIVDLYIRRM